MNITTIPPYSITNNSFISGGYAINLSPITNKGIQISYTSDFSSSQTIDFPNDSTINPFIFNVTNADLTWIIANQLIYVRSYIKYSGTYYYGNPYLFKTLSSGSEAGICHTLEITIPSGTNYVLPKGSVIISSNQTINTLYSDCIDTTKIPFSNNGTITLSSGNLYTTISQNTGITPIVFQLGNGATNITMTGSFPAGISGNLSGTTYTISGTPSVKGVFQYTLFATGATNNDYIIGNITVI
jgi:hypothetical protein